jgi:hypothetical protein
MNRIDERVARCLGLLRGPEFEPLMKFLRDTRQETLEALVVLSDSTAIGRHQGKADFMKDLIGYVDQADILISKLKR